MSSQRRVLTTRRAQRGLDALDASTRTAIIAALAAFARGEPNAHIQRLQGYSPPRSRLRVGDYRVIFALEPGVIVVEDVLNRRKAYRR